MSIIIKELVIKSVVYEGNKNNHTPTSLTKVALKREITKVCSKMVNDALKKIKER
jgi:hypothetical protein